MRTALMLGMLLILLPFAFAANTQSYAKNVFRDQMRMRFLYPEQWESKPIVENSGSFIRENRQLNIVYRDVIRPPKQPHVLPDLSSGSPNIDFPVRRKGIFDRGLEREHTRYFQTNDYIKNYARRVRKEQRQFRHVPTESTILDRFGLLAGRPASETPAQDAT